MNNNNNNKFSCPDPDGMDQTQPSRKPNEWNFIRMCSNNQKPELRELISNAIENAKKGKSSILCMLFSYLEAYLLESDDDKKILSRLKCEWNETKREKIYRDFWKNLWDNIEFLKPIIMQAVSLPLNTF